MNLQEARAKFATQRPMLEARGIILPGVESYLPEGYGADISLAMDAQPAMFTAPVNGVPAYLTTMIDPNVLEVLFTPTKAAEIIGEEKRGTWLDDLIMFPIVEHAGEVSSYGDWNNNGSVSLNAAWPTRQSYLFQTVKQYGERQIERAGRARLNWVAGLDKAAADVMNRFLNLSYFYGISGLQLFGLLNDPGLLAAITPATKAYGSGTHTQWIYGGIPQATANEVYADIQGLFAQLVAQSGGLIDAGAPMTLAMSPTAELAMTITNSFGVSVRDLLKKNFPNLNTVVTAVQFGARSGTNPQGFAGGGLLMLIAKQVNGQQTMFAAYNEKMRGHPIIRAMSSYMQKVTGGTWGSVIRVPWAIASMVGVE